MTINSATHDKNGNPLDFAIKPNRIDYHLLPKETTFPSMEDLVCETQLSGFGSWEALDFRIDGAAWRKDSTEIEPWWVPFQPRPGTLNDRESILIYGAEGSNPWDSCGLSQLAKNNNGVQPLETSMTIPTIARNSFSCLKEVFDWFDPLARTFALRLNGGGHFPPHRDHILLNRATFRLIAFLGDSTDNLRWEIEGKPVQFTPNTVYYVDTKKSHRLWSGAPKSTMVVFNVIKNWENVLKVASRLKHR
jgi:hypothetical protein